jgi:hypothetical protein
MINSSQFGVPSRQLTNTFPAIRQDLPHRFLPLQLSNCHTMV